MTLTKIRPTIGKVWIGCVGFRDPYFRWENQEVEFNKPFENWLRVSGPKLNVSELDLRWYNLQLLSWSPNCPSFVIKIWSAVIFSIFDTKSQKAIFLPPGYQFLYNYCCRLGLSFKTLGPSIEITVKVYMRSTKPSKVYPPNRWYYMNSQGYILIVLDQLITAI